MSGARFDFRVVDLGQAIAYYSAMFGQPPSTHGPSAVWHHGGSRASVTVSSLAGDDPGRAPHPASSWQACLNARRLRGVASGRLRQRQ